MALPYLMDRRGLRVTYRLVYPTCDHSLARAPTLKPQRAENATYCEGMNYAIV